MGYVDFFKSLKMYRHLLTRQELQTLRGQAMAGDYDAAKKGLTMILNRKRAESGRNLYAKKTSAPV